MNLFDKFESKLYVPEKFVNYLLNGMHMHRTEKQKQFHKWPTGRYESNMKAWKCG